MSNHTLDTSAAWLLKHIVAIATESNMEPEFWDTLDLSARLLTMAISEEDQEKASVLDAASQRLLELFDDIERIRYEAARG